MKQAVKSSITQRQVCPWCLTSSGYRTLTSRESTRVLSRILVQGTYLGAVHAVGLLLFRNREDLDYFRGLLGSGSELCCQACNHVVRVCPRCDAVSKWIDSDVYKCEACSTAFV